MIPQLAAAIYLVKYICVVGKIGIMEFQTSPLSRTLMTPPTHTTPQNLYAYFEMMC